MMGNKNGRGKDSSTERIPETMSVLWTPLKFIIELPPLSSFVSPFQHETTKLR